MNISFIDREQCLKLAVSLTSEAMRNGLLADTSPDTLGEYFYIISCYVIKASHIEPHNVEETIREWLRHNYHEPFQEQN